MNHHRLNQIRQLALFLFAVGSGFKVYVALLSVTGKSGFAIDVALVAIAFEVALIVIAEIATESRSRWLVAALLFFWVVNALSNVVANLLGISSGNPTLDAIMAQPQITVWYGVVIGIILPLVIVVLGLISAAGKTQDGRYAQFVAYWVRMAREAQAQVSAELADLQAQLADALSRVATAEAQLAAKAGEINELKQKLAGATAKADAKDEGVVNLRAQLADALSRVAAAEAQLAAKAGESATAQPQPDNLQEVSPATLRVKPERKPATKHETSTDNLSGTRLRVYQLKLVNPKASDTEIAKMISAETGSSISRQAVGSHRRALNGLLSPKPA